MMRIELNGATFEVAEHTTMAELIELRRLTGRRLAVEVNAELLPRGRFADYRLAPGDRVEIIHAVGGG